MANDICNFVTVNEIKNGRCKTNMKPVRFIN